MHRTFIDRMNNLILFLQFTRHSFTKSRHFENKYKMNRAMNDDKLNEEIKSSA